MTNLSKTFDPFSSHWLSTKFETYYELRWLDKAHYSEEYNGYLISRYDDVRYVLKNDKIFSSASGNLIREDTRRFGRTLGASDDPHHEELKNIVKEAYSKKNIQRIADEFTRRATMLLSKNKKGFNLSDMVQEISAWTSTEIVNVPYDPDKIQKLLVGILKHSEQTVQNVTESGFNLLGLFKKTTIDQTYYNDFVALVKQLLKDRVKPTKPGVYKEFFENDPDYPYLSLFTGPTISGASSLAGALAFLTVDIAREDLFDRLNKDRTLIPGLIQESLRYHSSSGRKARTVTQHVTVHNVDLKPGDRVIVLLESANRDPLIFPEPDKFNIERDNAGSLSFGYGIHACIATAISKELMAKWVEMLLDVIGKYEVTPDPSKYVYLKTSSGNQDTVTNLKLKAVK